MKNIFCLLAGILLSFSAFGQENAAEIKYAHNTFEGTRVVVGHSVEMLKEGEMDFLIAHKFGRINSGLYDFFGLDQAIIRIGFDYAPKDWINIGIGRSSLDKQVDGFVKLRLLRQQSGAKNIPVSVTGLSTGAITLLRSADVTEPIVFQNRVSYCHQVIIARQFGEHFSVQVSPSVTHYNLVENRDLKNDVFSIGAAGKYQLTKALAFKAEYYYSLPNQLAENKTNSLALGFDIDTGSHVFQMHLSNSGGLTEPAFIGNTTGDWLKGDIHFGFTISRVFKLKGRRY